MASILHRIISEYSIEYFFKNPRIYPKSVGTRAVSDFSKEEKDLLEKKRWYVYYSYFNPKTQKFEKQPPIYARINKDFPDFNLRYKAVHRLRRATKGLLEDGYNPFTDRIVPEDEPISIKDAIAEVKERKKKILKETSYATFLSHINAFSDFLAEKNLWQKPITKLDRKTIKSFLNKLDVSNRTINNYKTDISSLFTEMVRLDYIEHNFVDKIPNLKTDSTAHAVYTQKEQDLIFDHLEKYDPDLLFFIKFFTFTITRPIDACRIKIKDLDFENKCVFTTNKKIQNQKRVLPQILIDDFPDLSGFDKNSFLFPGASDSAMNRAKQISKRFSTVRDKLGFEKRKYTMYGFRHTIISRIFNKKLKETGNFEKTVSETMAITQHSTRKSFFSYAKSINLLAPEDYSEYLK
ncbi:MAG TPA: site-specific integrase [Flavobacteriaceae bacterium]|nr:site-specific integrase [Flavobacteriaceae bacterium]